MPLYTLMFFCTILAHQGFSTYSAFHFVSNQLRHARMSAQGDPRICRWLLTMMLRTAQKVCMYSYQYTCTYLIHIYKLQVWITLDLKEIWKWDLHHSAVLVKAAKSLAPTNAKNSRKVVYLSFLNIVAYFKLDNTTIFSNSFHITIGAGGGACQHCVEHVYKNNREHTKESVTNTHKPFTSPRTHFQLLWAC